MANGPIIIFPVNSKQKKSIKTIKMEGRQIYYSEKGLISTYDQIYPNGQQNGLEKAYRASGIVSSTDFLQNGKMDGEYKEYFAGGQLKTVAHYTSIVIFPVPLRIIMIMASRRIQEITRTDPWKELYKEYS